MKCLSENIIRKYFLPLCELFIFFVVYFETLSRMCVCIFLKILMKPNLFKFLFCCLYFWILSMKPVTKLRIARFIHVFYS